MKFYTLCFSCIFFKLSLKISDLGENSENMIPVGESSLKKEILYFSLKKNNLKS